MARGSTERLLSQAAYCADYNSDDGEEVTESRKQANISVKRSGDLGQENKDAMSAILSPSSRPIADLQSDSGYSSRTQVTNASADSEQSAALTMNTAASSEVTAASSATSSNTRKSASSTKDKHKCKDLNCRHRGRSSKSKTSASPSQASAQSPPPSTTRKASPTKRSTRTPRPQPDIRHESRPLPSRAATSPAQRPPPGGYAPHPYSHPPPPIMVPPYDPRADPRYRAHGHHAPYPYPAQGGYMVQVNRAQASGRPPMMHRASDNMSASPLHPRGSYAPPMIHQNKPRLHPSINPRKARSEDDAEDEDEYGEESESDEEEERAVMYARFRDQQHAQRVRQAEAQRYELAQKNAMIFAAQRNQQNAAREAMLPPPRPSSTVNPVYSMRGIGASPPLISYDASPRLPSGFEGGYVRPQYPPEYLRAPSPSKSAVPRSRTPGQDPHYVRRNSTYSDRDVQLAELEARERAVANDRKVLAREREQLRRQQRESFDAGAMDAELRFKMRRMSMGRDEHAIEEKKLSDAHRHIEKNKDSVPPLTAGILKNAGLDRKATPSTRSKKSSREGTTSMENKRRSGIESESGHQEDFRMRIDAGRDYEFAYGDKVVGVRPDGEGKMELYVAGKTETQYHGSKTSKASSSSGSKPGRRASRRTRYAADEDEDDIATEKEQSRQAHRDIRGGGARRRAETHSGTVDPRQRLREPARPHTIDERGRRGPLRRPASPVMDDEDEEDDDDEAELPPALYNAQLDEYGQPLENPWSQGHERPIPRPRYGQQGNRNSFYGP